MTATPPTTETTPVIHPATRMGPVHYTVADLSRQVSFYQERLGFKLHWREGGGAGGTARAGLGGGGPDLLRLINFQEGTAVQVMHIGPYSAEPATLDRMRAFAEEQGYRLHNLHHEIYTGDPRRTTPEKLKTVLRHPVARAV